MRRAILILLVGCGGGGGAGAPDAANDVDAAPPYDPLEGIGTVELVQGGFAFLEGPQWDDARNRLLFSDTQDDAIHTLTPPSTIGQFRVAVGPNGSAIDPTTGDVITCLQGGRAVERASFVPSNLTTIVSTYQGARLNSPNDVIRRSDGTLYFTDPPYGIQDNQRELDFVGTFRLTSDGTLVAEKMGALTDRPNGVALSPDEATLYVDDTDAGLVHAYDVAPDGSLSGERTLTTETPNADGMAVDAGGNLFVAASDGVRVIAPDGTLLGTIAVPEQPANCAFGTGDHETLYITARTGLYKVRVTHPGLPTH